MSSIFALDLNEAKKLIADAFGSESHFPNSYMVTDSLSGLECLEAIRSRKVTSLLQNSIQSLSDKLSLLKSIDYKGTDYFQNSLSVLNSEVVATHFTPTDDRNEIIQKAFQDAMLDLDMTKYQYVYQVATELVMNAQIDAPKISKKSNVDSSVLIVEKNMNKGLVAISVIDSYGSLDCYKMLENIYAAHKGGFRDSMSKNSIGAGLGSALIFEHCDSLLIGTISDDKSRVTAILPYGVSEKKINQIQKSIYIIRG